MPVTNADVFLTVDVELWPIDWRTDPVSMTDAFDRYILGKISGKQGAYGLPLQLKMLAERKLKAVFYVEAFFSYSSSVDDLKRIIQLIQSHGQEVGLHLHTEWVAKGRFPLLPGREGMNLRDFSSDEQRHLIERGVSRIKEAGNENVIAFRAGNFGANRDTLTALAANGLRFDSSHNRASLVVSPMLPETVASPKKIDAVWEYPLTVFAQWNQRLRPAQVGSCSAWELTSALDQVARSMNGTFVLYWHSAELLAGSRLAPDPIVIRRFERLLDYLADKRDTYVTRHFSEIDDAMAAERLTGRVPVVPFGATLRRVAEQSLRRIF